MSFFAMIPLTRGKVAMIDTQDLARVLAVGKWSARWTGKGWYAVNSKGRSVTYLHRFILGLTDHATQGEHENRDGLDCRRRNLRVASQSQNNANRGKQLRPATSRFKGVDRHAGKWRARIKKDGRQISLGHFASPEDAASAYNDAARDLHGDFALLNVVSGSGFEPLASAMSTQRSNRSELTGPETHDTAPRSVYAETRTVENVAEN